MRRLVVALLVSAAVVAVVAGAVLREVRDREWVHGGDGLTVDVEVLLATQETFEGVVTRFGAPPGKATRFVDADQSVVVQVRWSGLTPADGRFQVIVLDRRVVPPRPLAADGGWNSDGATGSNWAGAYDTLAEHYDWMRGVAAENFTDARGMTEFPTAAVDAPAAEAGMVCAWFRQWGAGRIPFGDLSREIVVALVYVDRDGEVRWARRVFG